MRRLHKDFIFHPGDVRKALHAGGVAARHRGGSAQQQRAGSAGGHGRGFHTEQLGEPRADLVVQVVKIDEMFGGFGPRFDDFRRHDRAAENRHRAGGVDDVLDAEGSVDVGLASPWPPAPRLRCRASPTARPAAVANNR